jgi:carbonic anhydrase
MNTHTKSPLSLLAILLSCTMATNALANDPPAAASAKPKAAAASGPSDDDLSKALLNKINKGSGDIVIRTGDLPVGNLSVQAKPEAKPETKPKVAKAPAKPVEKEPVVEKAPMEVVQWSYMDGPGGPENWGDISKENLACMKGKSQSPININVDRAVKVDMTPLEFLYRPSQLSIVDNGYTVMVNYGEGSNLIAEGRQYRLVQFHFHKPGEEAINGERTDMVAHLVHQHHDGDLLEVSVLMTTKPPTPTRRYWWGKDEVKENELIQTLWKHIPLVKGKVETPAVVIDVNQLLPANKGYFTYMGSLSTPPCTENVLRYVMKTPIYVSEEQVKNFDRIYPMNARPLQPKGDRLVKESTGN